MASTPDDQDNGAICIGPGEYVRRGYYLHVLSKDCCLIFVLPGYTWQSGQTPPGQPQYWSVLTLEKAVAFTNVFPAVISIRNLPLKPLPEQPTHPHRQP
jgi:hypothetical protein